MVTDTSLWVEVARGEDPDKVVLRTPRIGVDRAGEWALTPLRFAFGECRWVSRRETLKNALKMTKRLDSARRR
jgi:hypothetical protein